ncbi:U4/U6.U5 tri-snRNP-associated protein 1 isoform X1 [Bombyx mandarina]|uniref:U4/U6.U5 tri-snRNP-associated protein 1 n=4 Tax=Bombyx TaxID=7090 RepID=A0A8R2AIS8_BOMMO|nr:U4/U6.U5 tri-snRNP-associated protein 1 isoform X1 [Bombyx mori]XP_028036021.1 U4/U6.U5 tri-snRNP-associated protein 1 isoform X1 [Bombyx mandarina]
MGSKKHKKEAKKKKHKSRSRSPLEGEERERKRHRKHKDRKRERSPDVQEVPVDSHQLKDDETNHSRGDSEDRDRRMRALHRPEKNESEGDKSVEYEREKTKSPVQTQSGGAQESLSIEETNRLRAKLGLKPLEVNEKPADDGKFKDDLGEFYHKPATNITEQKKTEKLKEKIKERKEKRNIEEKLQTTLLGEGSDDDDASAWVKRSRAIETQKKEAAKRAAMLDEMDAAFGVSALLPPRAPPAPAPYRAPSLRGLRVAHQLDALEDERETILTLADKEILAEDPEDVLINVNIVDNERYKKNVEERKKARAGYQAYDEEAELQASLGFRRSVLSKYDEQIQPDQLDKDKGFVIGDEASLDAHRRRELLLAQGPASRRMESLALPQPQLAADYMDQHEIQAKFKKTKRKGKMRTKPKDEPIDADTYDAAAAPLDTDDTDVRAGAAALVVDEEETEPDTELHAALARARRLRLKEVQDAAVPKVEELLERVKEEQVEAGPEGMLFDATAEFCRTLGEAPAYFAKQNPHSPEHNPDMDVEEAASGAWSRVDVDSEKPADLKAGSGAGALAGEPALGAGVAGALRLALSKGYLQRAGAAPAPPAAHSLAARHYSIEDKTYTDDDKHGRRERGYSGPLTDFREKSNFRPTVKLDYVDDDGRPLAPKEAFRYLSHKFHGKGPGKNKQEKRIKKAVQEGLMKKMSSTDTPLGTLQMLQDKQRETRSPYVLLSGAKRDAPH